MSVPRPREWLEGKRTVRELQESQNSVWQSSQGSWREVAEAGQGPPSEPPEGWWTLLKAEDFKGGSIDKERLVF